MQPWIGKVLRATAERSDYGWRGTLTHRHAGQADIVRELIDGAVGLREGNDNMAPGDQAWWERYPIGWSMPRGRPARP